MKPIKLFAIALVLIAQGALAQTDSTMKDTVVIPEYPFGEKGEADRGLYGDDNRRDVTTVYGYEKLVDATIVMVPKANVKGNRIYTYSLRESLEKRFGVNRFSSDVKFLDQPTCSNCTGFLIAPDVVVTAGHCMAIKNACEDYVWVLDYTNKLRHIDNQNYVVVDPNDIYTCEDVLDWKLVNNTREDYGFIRLDRKTNREPYRFRTGGNVSFYQNVYMIGAPSGLPLKLADNAYVVDNTEREYFKTSLDAFPGNSGGPVFDKGGWLEGILVRGDVVSDYNNKSTGDYMYDASCNCIKTVKFTSTYGRNGAQVQRIDWTNYELLKMAIYENVEYAIQNNNQDRLNKWLVYKWMVENKYTTDRGRYEFIAAKQNNLAALKAIMELSDDKNIVDDKGNSLIHYAVANGNKEMLSFLLEQGLNPNKVNSFGEFPLYTAVRSGNSEMVKMLLDKGANSKVNEKTYGSTPLHLAASYGYISIAGYLLDAGASIEMENSSGWNAIKVAKKAKQKAMKKYLKKQRKLRK